MKSSVIDLPTATLFDKSTGGDQYRLDNELLYRRVQIDNIDEDGNGFTVDFESSVPAEAAGWGTTGGWESEGPDLRGAWWNAYLSGVTPQGGGARPDAARVVDLFCGPGGLALGVRQLLAEAGRKVVTELAVDQDAGALSVYTANHDTRSRSLESVASLVDFRLRGWGEEAEFIYPPEILDDSMAQAAMGADLLIAGPPCQGHSNLNNRSRRDDRRNLLYLTVGAFAVAAKCEAVIIENVPAVVHDRTSVVQTTRRLLESEGYFVSEGCLAADAMGWPQSRRRFFLVACRSAAPLPLELVANALADNTDHGPRSVLWAIGDERATSEDPIMNQLSSLSQKNIDRIAWLFDNDEHDLGLAERPVCHQEGTTYSAVYGRMRGDKPAGTITTGFMTPGRGRFVHPTKPRTLTPAEAARLQGFPLNYRFTVDKDNPPPRAQLAKWIGDAVPMPLGYGAALSALGPQLSTKSDL